MDRRDFIRNTGTFIAGATLASHALAADAEAASTNTLGRLVFPMNRNWLYGSKFTEATSEKGFDDAGFERVVVPHTNVRLPWHGFDEKRYELVSIYRRHFKVPSEGRGKHIFVHFEGVMTASTVWLNGQRLGEYKGGYTPFFFELTPHVDFDGDNVLAVAVDSTERPDIPPFGYEIDYLTFGGIYREVALRIVPSTFIENIFVRPKDVLGGKPSVDVECFLNSTHPLPSGLTLEAELLDGSRSLSKTSQRIAPAGKESKPGAAEDVTTAVVLHFSDVSGVKLWDLEHRGLYSVGLRLLQGSQVVD